MSDVDVSSFAKGGFEIKLVRGKLTMMRKGQTIAKTEKEFFDYLVSQNHESISNLQLPQMKERVSATWNEMIRQKESADGTESDDEKNSIETLLNIYRSSAKHKRLVMIKSGPFNKDPLMYYLSRRRDNIYEVIPLTSAAESERKIYEVFQDGGGKTGPAGKIIYDEMMRNERFHVISEVQSTYSEDLADSSKPPVYTYLMVPSVEAKPFDQCYMPNWNQFLDRLDDREAFCAWIWSVFEYRHNGRQMLYLEGKGEDGKTSVQKVITAMLGEQFSEAADTTTLSSADSHGLSSLVGKRLIYIADNKNQHLLKMGKLHNITGGDNIKINPKNETPYTINVYGRVWCNGNVSLDIEDKHSDLTRILYLNITQPNMSKLTPKNEWEAGLKDEWNDFRAFCRWCYSERCHDDYKIVSMISDENKTESIAVNAQLWVDQLSSIFQISRSDDDFISRETFSAMIKKAFPKLGNSEIQSIKENYARMGLEDFSKKEGHRLGRTQRGYRGIRAIVDFYTPPPRVMTESKEESKQPTIDYGFDDELVEVKPSYNRREQ